MPYTNLNFEISYHNSFVLPFNEGAFQIIPIQISNALNNQSIHIPPCRLMHAFFTSLSSRWFTPDSQCCCVSTLDVFSSFILSVIDIVNTI